MATDAVPGANPSNNDELSIGCWAEHKDGSLVLVKGVESDTVVYEIYDVAQDPPTYYQDAMSKDDFEQAYSRPPTGKSDVEWTWHDKTEFPWSRVMQILDRPRPVAADVRDTLSAAAAVADSLRLRAHKMSKATVAGEEQLKKVGQAIFDRVTSAVTAAINELTKK